MAYGPDRLGAAIADNCERAAQMGQLVQASPHMALMAPVVSNLCVFTADTRLPPAEQSALNTKIAQDLQLAGEAVFSTVTLNGITALRAAITNHRTRPEDITLAIAAVERARAGG
jgi:glutamate/tyrosine decarboxylase-like PLP-dependent enzyme